MVFLIVAGIDQPAPAAAQVGTAAGPVLQMDEDFAGPDVLALGALNQGCRHFCSEFRRFGETAHVPAPAGFRDYIDLRAKEHVQAHGAELFGHDFAEAAHHGRVAARRDAHLAFAVGDMGKILRTAHMAAQLGAVAGIR